MSELFLEYIEEDGLPQREGDNSRGSYYFSGVITNIPFITYGPDEKAELLDEFGIRSSVALFKKIGVFEKIVHATKDGWEGRAYTNISVLMTSPVDPNTYDPDNPNLNEQTLIRGGFNVRSRYASAGYSTGVEVSLTASKSPFKSIYSGLPYHTCYNAEDESFREFPVANSVFALADGFNFNIRADTMFFCG